MSLADQDIELLEDSLDGALAPGEATKLGERVGSEMELSTALEGLRAERALRGAVWASLEPSEDDVERLIGRVKLKTAATKSRFAWWRSLGIAGGIAACVAISFVSGWKLHTRQVAGGGPTAHPKASAVVTYQVALTDENGRVTAVQNFDS